MTIRPGDPWGSVQAAPASTRWFNHESELGKWLEDGNTAADVGLRRGDLHAITGVALSVLRVPIDIIEVTTQDARTSETHHHIAISSVVVGTWWRRASFTVMSNTGLVDGVEWFARSHPNDGRIESAEFSEQMELRQRIQARRRVKSGSPYAHPQISSSSLSDWEWSGPGRRLVIDGRQVGLVSRVQIAVRPDALHVYLGQPSTGS
jgi:hypothetical protein